MFISRIHPTTRPAARLRLVQGGLILPLAHAPPDTAWCLWPALTVKHGDSQRHAIVAEASDPVPHTPGGTSATRHDIGPQVLSCGELQPPAGWHTTSHAFQQHVAASASHITPASLHELLLHSPSLLSVLSGRAACSCKDACAHAMHVGMLQDAGHFEPSPRPSTQGQPCTMTPLAATAVTTV